MGFKRLSCLNSQSGTNANLQATHSPIGRQADLRHKEIGAGYFLAAGCCQPNPSCQVPLVLHLASSFHGWLSQYLSPKHVERLERAQGTKNMLNHAKSDAGRPWPTGEARSSKKAEIWNLPEALPLGFQFGPLEASKALPCGSPFAPVAPLHSTPEAMWNRFKAGFPACRPFRRRH